MSGETWLGRGGGRGRAAVAADGGRGLREGNRGSEIPRGMEAVKSTDGGTSSSLPA